MKLVVVGAIVAAACAHTPDPGLRPITPLPDGAKAGVFAARDKTQLATLEWTAAPPEPRGVVVIMHGLKDHASRYGAFATRLTAAGYAVHAFDLRGHGHSAGPRVSPKRWVHYVDDLDLFVTSVEHNHPGKKVFVFGHSMGGAIATLFAMRHQPQVAGVILSAPALAIDAAPLLIAATRMAGTLTPDAKALDLANADFSSDPAITRAMGTDPMISQTPGPARTAAGLVDGMRVIWQNTELLTVPLLALHGTRDALTSPDGSRALVRKAASTDKTLRIYDGLFHDLLHEPKGKQVENDIVAWLDAHAGGEPVVAPPIFPGTLRGEPGEWTQAVELGAGVNGLGGDSGLGFAGTIAIQLGKLRPFGWHGALTAQLIDDYKAVSLRPAGLAVRLGGAALGVSAGGSFITGTKFALSFGAFGEIPLGQGPAHVSLLAERQRQITNTNMHGPIGSDQLLTSVSLRFGADRRYWPDTIAGVGPVATAGLAWLADVNEFFITVGLQLYGAD